MPEPEKMAVESAASEQEPMAAAAPEAAPGPEELLKQAQQEAAQAKDAWLRAVAEQDNIRKRAQADVGAAHKFALEGFAGTLLPVKDSLESALAAENATQEHLRSGVELTLKLLGQAFEKHRITEINPAPGEKFDPHRHQAMCAVDSDAHAPNTVINVMQKGYALNDRVLRPALVTVAKAKEG
ncbi:MAG TPA: nucleotide exchange factor GrpE [Burkholderiales bacterium]|nr:nucleotide exchange factor GrpE [Burkholderiales bacterium]